jgi:HTH-type transcriptional regulator / antitoxin HipB
MAKTAVDIGTIVRLARLRQGLTQEAAAGLAGVGPRFLGELERGKESVELGKVLRVLTSLGLDLSVRSREHRGT